MKLSIFLYFVLFFCSLFLFILGLKLLTYSLNKLSSKKIKALIYKFSNKDYQAFLLGIIVTSICQSSNAICAITLSFVTASYISFRKGLIIIIGSNIGTTITSIFFSFNIQDYAFIFLIIGLAIYILIKNKLVGVLIISLGLLLFGLKHLSIYLEMILKLDSVKPLLIKFNNSNFICFIIGIILSFLIQSSSGTIGMIQTLHEDNLICLSSGVAFMLGANIGTTITGIFVGTLGSKQAKYLGIINFLFNFIGSVIFLLLINVFTYFLSNIQYIYSLSNSFTISLSHIIYNIITVFIFFIILLISKKQKFNLSNIFI